MFEISRVTRSKADARVSYDRMSSWYDFLAGGSEKKYQDIGISMLDLQPGEKVLEIGFGTGRALLSLAHAVGEAGKVYGLDLSEGMLGIARARIRKAVLESRVELECGDAVATSYADQSFDAVFMCFTLELFDTPEIPLVLRECRRLLRPEGRLAVVAMSKKGAPNLMTRLYDWGHRHIPNYVDCRPIYAQQAVEEAGLTIAKVEVRSMWGLPVEILLAGA